MNTGELMVRFVVVILQFLFFTRACAIVRFGVTSSPSSVLFRSYHETAERALHSLTKDILRTKLIELPHDRPAFKVGELIEFDLFDGLIYYGDVTSFVMRNPTSACWFGNLHSSASLLHEIEGEFELSCDQKACVANLNVYSTGDEYIISPANNLPLTEEGAGIYQLSQYSREKKRSGLASQSAESFIIDHTSHLHEKASSLKKIQSSQVGTMAVDTDLILDCFVMYTPEALAKIGGR